MADLNKIVDDLSSLTVLEAAELAKLLEEKWGVSAAAAVASGESWTGVGVEPSTSSSPKMTESVFSSRPMRSWITLRVILCHQDSLGS